MFDFSAIPEPWQTLCWLILLGVTALLIGGFVLSPYDVQRTGRMKKISELPQTALLIGLALLFWLSAGRTEPIATLITAGIVVGFVGDLFMANVFKQNEKDHVLSGMAAFGVGHVLYILAFREIAVQYGLHDAARYALALIITWAIAALLWLVLVRKPGGSRMQYAALAYGLFLASMAGFALGLALQRAAFLPLAVGAVLFVLSDTLIAARLFAGRTFRYMGDAIWLTYIVAQVLIVTVIPLTSAASA